MHQRNCLGSKMIRAILVIHERHRTHDNMVLKWPTFVGNWSVYGKKMSIWAPRHHLRSAWSGWFRWPSPYMIRCDYGDISHGSGCFIIVELSTKNIVLPQFSAICSCFWNLWWAISLRVRGLRGFWKHFYMSYFSWRIHWYPWFCRAIPRSCSDRYFGL